MKHGFVKVAALTPKIRVADPAWNAEAILKKIKEAQENKAKIMVFPELCITGFTCQDLFLQERMLEEAKKALLRIKDGSRDVEALIFVGLPLERDGKLYNVAAALFKGKILGFVPKMCLPNYAEFYEVRHFVSGEEKPEDFIFEGEKIPFGSHLLFSCANMQGLKVGCELCEDVWTVQPPSTAHAMAGATVIVNLSASNDTVGKGTYRKSLICATSARLLCGYIYTSAGDGESTQDLVFGGHNLIAENGSLLKEAKRFENQSIYTELDIHRLCHERRRMTTFKRQRAEDYREIFFELKEELTPLTRKFDSAPFVPSVKEERDLRCDEILSIQSMGLKKRYEHTNCQSAVIGVSGGLDSTLALLVTVRAFDMLGLDRSKILAVTMPCFGTTDRTYSNACKMAQTLGTTLKEVNIRESVSLHFRDIGQDPNKHDVTYENGQARERTQVLMDLANQTGGMVIGTGDMSELALGWATYNGDHMSMYGVNAGVPKTLVRHLVQYYADTCGQEELRKVLLDVLDTPVSPELLPPVDGVISQKTEDLVGPYELHDFYLYYMLRCGFEPEKIYRLALYAFQGIYDKETIFKWLKTFYRRFFTQQFKRSCLPDGPKVGSVAVSPRGDLRMPSDASAAAWMSAIEAMEEKDSADTFAC